MASPNVLVSGAGIAGGVFANALLRGFPDANITIVERSPSMRLTGSSVDIRSSAVDIIKEMGVEGEIKKHTTNEEGVSFVNSNGNAIATFRATGNAENQSMTSEYEIFRGKLAEIFLKPVLDKVKIIYGEIVERYEQLDDGVYVTFRESKRTQKYDLLVAADGLGSKIRGQMLNSRPRDHIYDQGAHVAYFTIKKDLLDGCRLAKWYTTDRGRSILLRPDPHPAGRTRGHFMNITPVGTSPLKARLDQALLEGNDSYKALLEEDFADVGWLAPETLQGMREADDFYCSLFAQVRSPEIYDGRVVLLGDAGYATPGIGTSLAIIGGYVLAGELLRSGYNVPIAVNEYAKLVQPFVKENQSEIGGGMRFMNPQSAWALSIRNSLLRLVSWSQLDRLAFALGSKLGYGERKLRLPDYQWPK